jgi:hypothetical protein
MKSAIDIPFPETGPFHPELAVTLQSANKIG